MRVKLEKDNQFYNEKLKCFFLLLCLLEFVMCYVFSKLLYFENPFKDGISSCKSVISTHTY